VTYHLISPQSSEALGPWAPHFARFSEVVGYSSLGHFFLRDPSSNEYIVLHPFKRAAKSYGVHNSVGDFEAAVLKDAGFAEYVLRPAHVEAIAKRLGDLAPDEIYIPAPYPFLGGSEAPESYEKGDAWVFASIVGQMHGLGEDAA
jgi:hypothetical protein